MSRRDDEATVLDLLRAARLVIQFKGSLDQSAFLNDPKTQSAILHQLLIMGEASKRLSDLFRASHPGIPWKMIAGMRDKLIHDYDEADMEEVWNTVTVDVPRLVPSLESLVPTQGRPEA